MFEITVPDMSCGHCISSITKALKALDANAEIDISLKEKRVNVTTKARRKAVETAIAEAGYAVADVRSASTTEKSCCGTCHI